MKKAEPILVSGFRAGAIAAGVRYPGRLDLGAIIADRPCPAAGIFTTNRVKAPSITLNARRLLDGFARAVLVNSGNANACVGPRGLADAERCAAALAEAVGERADYVLMNSTGVIGEPLPADKIAAAVPALARAARPEGLADFSRAIITTDTRPKLFFRALKLPAGKISIAAVGKGAGMIMPNLATMLVYLLTDAVLSPHLAKAVLKDAAADSFNALTIDGDTSTSDSVIFMASGDSGVKIADAASRGAFQKVLNELCLQLARDMAADGEGATKMFAVTVEGARTKGEADKVARRVANSPLVKTAFNAADPNWGRIMMAVGSAGVAIDPDRVSVRFEPSSGKGVTIVLHGARAAGYNEAKAQAVLSGAEFTVRIGLDQGRAARTIYTCDFSTDYVKINADYRT